MILVLATPRSGSSWFVSNYLTECHAGYTGVGEPFNSYRHSVETQLTLLENYVTMPVIVKLFPQHLKNSLPNLFNRLVTVAEKIYILARKDYNAQLRSLYIAEHTGYFYSDSKPLRNILLHDKNFDLEDQLLRNSYDFLANAYRNLKNSQLVFLEDLPSTGKYNQPVVWDKEPPTVNFNVEQLFRKHT